MLDDERIAKSAANRREQHGPVSQGVPPNQVEHVLEESGIGALKDGGADHQPVGMLDGFDYAESLIAQRAP